MKYKLIIVLLIILSSCKTLEDKNLQTSIYGSNATVIGINEKKKYITLKWDCYTRPYKNQPCYSFSRHSINIFKNISVGDTIKISMQ